MEDKIAVILSNAKTEINDTKSLKDLTDIKVKYLGKSGAVTELLKGMKDVAKEDRPKAGKMVNDLRAEIENLLNEKEVVFKEI